MLPQQNIIARLRSCCQADDRVVAALLYGSFATGEADAYSDVECAVFFEEAALGDLDRRAWTERVGPCYSGQPSGGMRHTPSSPSATFTPTSDGIQAPRVGCG